MTIRHNGNNIGALLYFYFTTITGWGLLLKPRTLVQDLWFRRTAETKRITNIVVLDFHRYMYILIYAYVNMYIYIYMYIYRYRVLQTDLNIVFAFR